MDDVLKEGRGQANKSGVTPHTTKGKGRGVTVNDFYDPLEANAWQARKPVARGSNVTFYPYIWAAWTTAKTYCTACHHVS
jgi:hypothetical protein